MCDSDSSFSKPAVKYTKLFINNDWVNSVDGGEIDVINPVTEGFVCSVQRAQQGDVDAAVRAARAAFQTDAPWRTMEPAARGKVMEEWCRLISRDAPYIARLETLNTGKPYSDALEEVGMTVDTIRYYAGYADKIHGNTIPSGPEYMCLTRREPVGVVGQIIPWNYPIMMVSWKVGPALAAGCTVVLKPSELTPLSALYVGQLAVEAGFPAGVLNIVPGFGKEAGTAIAEHADIDKVAFTGSTAVGKEVMCKAAASNLKRCSLELGGKSPVVVCDDCEGVDSAAEVCHGAVFNNHGQNCCAGTRTYVQQGIHDAFIHRAVQLAKERVLGDPYKEGTQQGPQISKLQMTRILNYIDIGIKEGATLETGGKRWGTQGFYVEPSVFSGVTDDMTIAREEIFGPVQVIMKFDTLDEAIKRANDSHYGLACGIITSSVDKALYFANRMLAGSVWVNCYDAIMPQTPFGGFKQSGHGRELGEAGLDEYLEDKTITIKIPAKL